MTTDPSPWRTTTTRNGTDPVAVDTATTAVLPTTTEHTAAVTWSSSEGAAPTTMVAAMAIRANSHSAVEATATADTTRTLAPPLPRQQQQHTTNDMRPASGHGRPRPVRLAMRRPTVDTETALSAGAADNDNSYNDNTPTSEEQVVVLAPDNAAPTAAEINNNNNATLISSTSTLPNTAAHHRDHDAIVGRGLNSGRPVAAARHGNESEPNVRRLLEAVPDHSTRALLPSQQMARPTRRWRVVRAEPSSSSSSLNHHHPMPVQSHRPTLGSSPSSPAPPPHDTNHTPQQRVPGRRVHRVRIPRGARVAVLAPPGDASTNGVTLSHHATTPAGPHDPPHVSSQGHRRIVLTHHPTNATTTTQVLHPSSYESHLHTPVDQLPLIVLPDEQQELVEPAQWTASTTDAATTETTTTTDDHRDDQSNPHETNGSNPDSPDDENDDERYKCTICYEFLVDPVGCGTCSGRYCRLCLQKVTQQQHRSSSSSSSSNPATTKCPLCRANFRHPTPDPTLADALDRLTLPCRYANCTPRTRRSLADARAHDAVCPAAKVACRFRPYGCGWTGLRGQPGDGTHHHHDHHQTICPYAQVSGLLDRHRLQSIQLGALGHTVLHTQAAVANLDRAMRGLVQYQPSHPAHVAAFVTTVVWATPRVVRTPATWHPLVTPHGRAVVANAMVVTPTVVWMVGKGLWNVRQGWLRETLCNGTEWMVRAVRAFEWETLDQTARHGAAAVSTWNLSFVAARAWTLMLAGLADEYLCHRLLFLLAGMVFVTCLWAEGSSPCPQTWKTVLWPWGAPRSAEDMANHTAVKKYESFLFLSTLWLYYAMVDWYDGNPVLAALVCLALAWATLVVPATVVTLSMLLAKNDRGQPPAIPTAVPLRDVLTTGKVGRPLVLGMMAGLNLRSFGVHAGMDAFFGILIVLPYMFPSEPAVQALVKDLNRPRIHWISFSNTELYFAVRCLGIVYFDQKVELFCASGMVFQALFCAAVLAFEVWLVVSLAGLGKSYGTLLYAVSREEVLRTVTRIAPTSPPVLNDAIGAGYVLGGTWVVAMALSWIL